MFLNIIVYLFRRSSVRVPSGSGIFSLFPCGPVSFLGLSLSPRRHKPKKLHKGIRRRKGGGSIGPLPSTFDTIHPIDLIFGTCNELSLYFN